MDNTKLFRKRIIPQECVPLKDDVILYKDSDRIITKWNTLKPKKELHHGFSCYYLREGYKVSKFMRQNSSLMYWYCDIVTHTWEEETDTYVFTDLLADVVIYPDNFVKVMDLDEVGIALEKDLISRNESIALFKSLSSLLEIIYSGRFENIKSYIESFEHGS